MTLLQDLPASTEALDAKVALFYSSYGSTKVDKKMTPYDLSLKTDIVNVCGAAFGADPTGATSSTAAFAAAFAVAESTGWEVYIPKGSYDLATWTEYISLSPFSVVGEDRNSTIISGPGTDGAPRFLSFVGGVANFNGTGTVQLSGVHITGFRDAIKFDAHLKQVSIFNCKFTENTRYAAFAVWRNDSSDSKIDHIEFESNIVEDSLGHLFACEFKTARSTGNRMTRISRETYTNETSIDTIAIGIGDTNNVAIATGQDLMQNVIVSHNHITEVHGTSTDGSNTTNGIIICGRHVLVVNNIIHDLYATNDLDSEGIYTKSHEAIIGFNVLTDIDCNGTGAITLKGIEDGLGTEPEGYNNMVAHNTIRATGDRSTDIGIAINAPHKTIVANNTLMGPIKDCAFKLYSYVTDVEYNGNVGRDLDCNWFIHADGVSSIKGLSVDGNKCYGLKGSDADDAASTYAGFCYLRTVGTTADDLSRIKVKRNEFIPRMLSANSTNCIFLYGFPTSDASDIQVIDNDFDITGTTSENFVARLTSTYTYDKFIMDGIRVVADTETIKSWLNVDSSDQSYKKHTQLTNSNVKNCYINGAPATTKTPHACDGSKTIDYIRLDQLSVGENRIKDLFNSLQGHNALIYFGGTPASSTNSATLEIRLSDSPGTGGIQILPPTNVASLASNGFTTSLLNNGTAARDFGDSADKVALYFIVAGEVFTSGDVCTTIDIAPVN